MAGIFPSKDRLCTNKANLSFHTSPVSFLFSFAATKLRNIWFLVVYIYYYIFSNFVSGNPPLCFHFASIVFYILSFCNSSLHKQSQSTFRSTNPCRVQHFVFLQFVFASTSYSKPHFCALCLFPKATVFPCVLCFTLNSVFSDHYRVDQYF